MKRFKKKLAVLVSVAILNSCVAPARVEASWFSDLMGGLFTIITCPIWVFCPNNPTFRKNNPFREKLWEEEDRKDEILIFKNRYNKIKTELEALKSDNTTILNSQQKEISILKHAYNKLNEYLEQLQEQLEEQKKIKQQPGPQGQRGENGKDGKDGEKGDKGDRGLSWNSPQPTPRWNNKNKT